MVEVATTACELFEAHGHTVGQRQFCDNGISDRSATIAPLEQALLRSASRKISPTKTTALSADEIRATRHRGYWVSRFDRYLEVD